jgi:hypothetical protein
MRKYSRNEEEKIPSPTKGRGHQFVSSIPFRQGKGLFFRLIYE